MNNDHREKIMEMYSRNNLDIENLTIEISERENLKLNDDMELNKMYKLNIQLKKLNKIYEKLVNLT